MKETLAPTKVLPASWSLYDCSEEKALGCAAPIACDLSLTTARVFACLPRALKTIAVSATQAVSAGEKLLVQAEFTDGANKRLAAVLPFHLALLRPDGKVQAEFYRATGSDGTFSMAIPIPANAPGEWRVTLRSQLTGQAAALPITVSPARRVVLAAALTEPALVRNREAIEAMLARGSSAVLPVFDDTLLAAAEQVKTVLAARGVTVAILRQPPTCSYTIAYDPTDAQLQENARADRGEAFGRIRRETVNGNDWASALSGWRFGKPVILLDAAGEKNANPLLEALDNAGLLWPQVSATFPGDGKAVVQAVAWAFAPRVTVLVIQAHDLASLSAGVQTLAKLPEDRLMPGITAAKTALWQQYHIGGQPPAPWHGKLTAKGFTASQAPQPFAIAFPTEMPPTAEQVKHPAPALNPAYPVPGAFAPKQFLLYYLVDNKWVETATVEFLMSDLRFSQALKLVAEVKTAGKVKVTATGIFRYSDRKPCWQAQWEDIINLRDKLVPKVRRPMTIEVQVNGKTAGTLIPGKIAQSEVLTEWGPAPKKATEEAVTELTGMIDLPAGRQETHRYSP